MVTRSNWREKCTNVGIFSMLNNYPCCFTFLMVALPAAKMSERIKSREIRPKSRLFILVQSVRIRTDSFIKSRIRCACLLRRVMKRGNAVPSNVCFDSHQSVFQNSFDCSSSYELRSLKAWFIWFLSLIKHFGKISLQLELVGRKTILRQGKKGELPIVAQVNEWLWEGEIVIWVGDQEVGWK